MVGLKDFAYIELQFIHHFHAGGSVYNDVEKSSEEDDENFRKFPDAEPDGDERNPRKRRDGAENFKKDTYCGRKPSAPAEQYAENQTQHTGAAYCDTDTAEAVQNVYVQRIAANGLFQQEDKTLPYRRRDHTRILIYLKPGFIQDFLQQDPKLLDCFSTTLVSVGSKRTAEYLLFHLLEEEEDKI